MAAHVSLNELCLEEYDKVRQGSYRYLTFALGDDNTKIVVDKTGIKRTSDSDTDSKEYASFKSDLTSAKAPSGGDGCRWAVYGFTRENQTKIAFISWIPKTAKGRTTMLYASARPILKTALNDIAMEIKAETPAELDLEQMLTQVFGDE